MVWHVTISFTDSLVMYLEYPETPIPSGLGGNGLIRLNVKVNRIHGSEKLLNGSKSIIS